MLASYGDTDTSIGGGTKLLADLLRSGVAGELLYALAGTLTTKHEY